MFADAPCLAYFVGRSLKIFQSLPHAFWNFAPLLPDAKRAVAMAAEWILNA